VAVEDCQSSVPGSALVATWITPPRTGSLPPGAAAPQAVQIRERPATHASARVSVGQRKAATILSKNTRGLYSGRSRSTPSSRALTPGHSSARML